VVKNTRPTVASCIYLWRSLGSGNQRSEGPAVEPDDLCNLMSWCLPAASRAELVSEPRAVEVDLSRYFRSGRYDGVVDDPCTPTRPWGGHDDSSEHLSAIKPSTAPFTTADTPGHRWQPAST
jgi:hypothetical protein